MNTKTDTRCEVELDETTAWELQTVLDYFWEDELRNYQESDPEHRSGHIFESLVVIDRWLQGVNRKLREAHAQTESRSSGLDVTTTRSPCADARRRRIVLMDTESGEFMLLADDGRTLLIEPDWARLARTFGWTPCPCGQTDGTVDCAHRKALDMIAEAYEFLTEHVGDEVDDPGYFR
jgi:hypothetical protein